MHVLPALGTRSLASIKPSAIQATVNGLSDKGLSPGSVANIYDVLRRVFEAALDDDVIAATPCRRIKLPKRDRSITPPTSMQVDDLIDALPRRGQVFPMVLAQSGLRIGEALGLKPDDVKPLEFHVTVERQRRQDGSIGPTKSGKGRGVPLSDTPVAA